MDCEKQALISHQEQGALSSPGNQGGAAGPGNNEVLSEEDGGTVGSVGDNQQSWRQE